MADEVYECILTGYLAGEFVQTVQHVIVSASGSVTAYVTAKELAADLVLSDHGIDALMSICPSDFVASSLRVRRVGPTGGPTAVVLAAAFAVQVGQRSGAISSAQANPLIIWIPTNLPNKTGRLFVPGVSETDINEMKLTAPLISAMNDFIDIWINGGTVSAGNYLGCVFRRSLSEGDQIADGRISPLIGTQRRRLHPV